MRLTGRFDLETAAALLLRCWLAYKLSGDRAYLHKAGHAAATVSRRNESDMRLLAVGILIDIEAERFDHANEMLDMALGYRNFLKNQEPLYYAVFCCLYAYLELRQHRVRSAGKHMKNLQEFAAEKKEPEFQTLLGIAHLIFGEYDDAHRYLTVSLLNGAKGVFTYYGLYYCYKNGPQSAFLNALPHSERTLLPVLLWASAADIEDILNLYAGHIQAVVAREPDAGERIYAFCQSPVILRALCMGRMFGGDFSREAYDRYRDAERKQLSISGLYPFLLKAAFVNGVERVNHYAMSEFLKTGEIDAELKVYVYHLLLTDPSLSDLLPARREEILRFANHCVENGLTGRMVNSLYYYFWTQCAEMGDSNQNAEKAEEYLKTDFTRFVVEASAETRFIYVTEPEKKGMAVYETVPRDNISEAVVSASDGGFSVVCLSAARRNILNEPVNVRRMVTRAEPALYRHFFRKGGRDFALVGYLANYYLNCVASMVETPGDDIITDVFEAALADKDISKPFKMRIFVALGGLYYHNGQFAKALSCYSAVDENYLDDDYIEQILNVFLQTREWARAAGLIMRKGRRVSDKALFNAIKQLSGPAHAAHHPNLAEAAYGLLTRSWFDHELLAIALSRYHGGQAEWQALSRALAAVNVNEPKLDEIILKNSIWMHQFDEDAEKTFARMAVSDPANPLLKRFTLYCSYEMIVNNARPNYETLTLLEKSYLAEPSNSLLAYALCHVYLRNNLNTFNSDIILQMAVEAQKAQGILLPVFREYRGKRPSMPYIEKNQPFIYRGLPDKNVWLYYRVDDETAFRAVQMRYFSFGLYLAKLPLFYREQLTYYFSEEMPTGSITTRESAVNNDVVYLNEKAEDNGDAFFVINNAIIYEQLFKHNLVEEIITGLVKDVKQVRSGLM